MAMSMKRGFMLWLVEQGVRRPRGACPCCGAAVLEWCDPDCLLVDPMDYR